MHLGKHSSRVVTRSGIAEPRNHELLLLKDSAKLSCQRFSLSQRRMLLFPLSFAHPGYYQSLKFLPIWYVKTAIFLLMEFAFPWLWVRPITLSYVYLPFVFLCELPIHIPCSFFLIRQTVFSLLIFMSFLSIMDINHFSVLDVANIFSVLSFVS